MSLFILNFVQFSLLIWFPIFAVEERFYDSRFIAVFLTVNMVGSVVGYIIKVLV